VRAITYPVKRLWGSVGPLIGNSQQVRSRYVYLLVADAEPPHHIEELVGGLHPRNSLPFSLCVSTYARIASRSCDMLV